MQGTVRKQLVNNRKNREDWICYWAVSEREWKWSWRGMNRRLLEEERRTFSRREFSLCCLLLDEKKYLDDLRGKKIGIVEFLEWLSVSTSLNWKNIANIQINEFEWKKNVEEYRMSLIIDSLDNIPKISKLFTFSVTFFLFCSINTTNMRLKYN